MNGEVAAEQRSEKSSLNAWDVARAVKYTGTQRCPRLARHEITRFVSNSKFGKSLGGHAVLYDHVAALANSGKGSPKCTDIVSKLWHVRGDLCLRQTVNLLPIGQRNSFRCVPDIYDYSGLPKDALIVDFANKKVGGGCFGGGFVQEEQMVAQSTDFATRLHRTREVLGQHQAASYEGVHMDAWWDRAACAMKAGLDHRCIRHRQSEPLTILAVDAPLMKGKRRYGRGELTMLASKVALVFGAAAELDAPLIYSGLLGGGAFRGIPVQALNDREKIGSPGARAFSQIGFVEFFVSPLLFVVMKVLPTIEPHAETLVSNVRTWQQQWLVDQSPPPGEEERHVIDQRVQRLVVKYQESL